MTAEFDPTVPLEILLRHGVRFVLIGGVAGNALGSPVPTEDLDVCYDRADDNLEHLAAALGEMKARLRGAPDGLPFQLDALTLKRGDSFTFDTVHGPVDILGTPSGTRGYPDLVTNAMDMIVGADLHVRVVALDDLIRMKAAAGRPKDLRALEELGALRDEVEGKAEIDDSHLYGAGRRPPLPPV